MEVLAALNWREPDEVTVKAEMAAAVRPMEDPDDWVIPGLGGLDKTLLQQFMAEARNKVS